MLMNKLAAGPRPFRGARAARASCRTVRVSAALKPMPRWENVYTMLMSKGLKSIEPEDAQSLVESGEWVILDVRPKEDYAKSHIQGSISVPLYQALDVSTGNTFQKALRFVAYKANGVNPVEPNESFVEQALQAAGGKGIVTVCEAGGTTKPTTNFPFGKASRSLQAAFRLMDDGGIVPAKVAHLERGIYGWYQADLDIVGDYKPEVGRTPSAASDPVLTTTVAARGYTQRPDDKK